jgi:hypothetical protein
MQRTGADPTASSTFSIAGVKVAGTSLPVTNDSLQAILTSVNTALATTGISLQMPKVTTGSDGSVTETPLSIGLDHSALGKEIFGPVVSTIQPLRNAIFNELAAIYPGSGDGDLFTEIVLGILAGQGSLDLDLGGTYAASDGTTYSNPFGDSPTAAPSTIGSSGSGLNGDATTGPGTSGEISPGDALVPADGGGSGSSGALATSPSASAPKQVALQRLGSSSSCRSTTVGSCRISDAKPVALLLLLATAALCVAEFVRQRRRKRMFMAAKPSGEAP